jgi:hypothetical protein
MKPRTTYRSEDSMDQEVVKLPIQFHNMATQVYHSS